MPGYGGWTGYGVADAMMLVAGTLIIVVIFAWGMGFFDHPPTQQEFERDHLRSIRRE